MSEPVWPNPAAAWWSPRRLAGLTASFFVFGVLTVVDGLEWQTENRWALVVIGSVVVLCAVVMLGGFVKRQGWAWLLRKDNSTTKWYSKDE
jgi:hypothetical protein